MQRKWNFVRSSGKNDEANLLDEALNTTPMRAHKITSAWASSQKLILRPNTPVEALALMLDTDLSKREYQQIWLEAKERAADIYPSYNSVRNAKKKCYPPSATISVSEKLSKVSLQGLLNHTAQRICEYSTDVLDSIPEDARKNLVLISKWGCDGSGNQANYKQRIAGEDWRIVITHDVPCATSVGCPSGQYKVRLC